MVIQEIPRKTQEPPTRLHHVNNAFSKLGVIQGSELWGQLLGQVILEISASAEF
jgi:hypothetical protein